MFFYVVVASEVDVASKNESGAEDVGFRR